MCGYLPGRTLTRKPDGIHAQPHWWNKIGIRYKKTHMQLLPLVSQTELDQLLAEPGYLALLKHNTTCPISKGVLQRLGDADTGVSVLKGIHVLDLLAHRNLSNDIADRFEVEHQSPQLLLLHRGKCIYTEWGYDISADAILEAIEDVNEK